MPTLRDNGYWVLLAELAANNTQYPLSLSVGMTRYAAEMRSSLQKLLAQADQALYKQKQASHAPTGGNSTVIFPGSRRGFAQYGFRAPGISTSQRLQGRVRKPSSVAFWVIAGFPRFCKRAGQPRNDFWANL